MADDSYLKVTQAVLNEHGGLWFNDEAFVVTRTGPVAGGLPSSRASGAS